MERKVEDIADTLKRAKERGKGCSLLIGAGCSQTAGIPTAGEIVKIIQEKCPREYERAKVKNYPCCMAELPPGERRDLIDEYVSQAKINWAHIAIGQLMKAGFIDRVLTTNFDPLVVRACALLGLFPAVYDFAVSQYYKRAFIPTPAVFYLHGQHSGFVLMNTEEECLRHSKQLEPLFNDVAQGRVWLVSGYSGENDPVFDHLANMKQFDEGLYWIGYQDNQPPRHVREKLLDNEKFAFYVKGYDADDFFVLLAQHLNCFPPTFVSKPFSHLNDLLAMIVPYKLPGQDVTIKVPKNTQKLIQTAITAFEKCEQLEGESFREVAVTEEPLQLESSMMAGDYDKVIKLESKIKKKPSDINDTISWAYIMQGNTYLNQTKKKKGAVADSLFLQAYEKYDAALQKKPDQFEAFNSWGYALTEQAKTKTGADADRLFSLAFKKYNLSLLIKPNQYDVLIAWGCGLSQQASMKTGVEAEKLLNLAGQKYEIALMIQPDNDDALNSWGAVLLKLAKLESKAKAETIFNAAREKLLRAEEIKPGKGAYNLACISALHGDQGNCRHWLEKCQEYNTLPDKSHLMTDSDLNNVGSCEWFQELIKDLE